MCQEWWLGLYTPNTLCAQARTFSAGRSFASDRILLVTRVSLKNSKMVMGVGSRLLDEGCETPGFKGGRRKKGIPTSSSDAPRHRLSTLSRRILWGLANGSDGVAAGG